MSSNNLVSDQTRPLIITHINYQALPLFFHCITFLSFYHYQQLPQFHFSHITYCCLMNKYKIKISCPLVYMNFVMIDGQVMSWVVWIHNHKIFIYYWIVKYSYPIKLIIIIVLVCTWWVQTGECRETVILRRCKRWSLYRKIKSLECSQCSLS